MNNMCFNNGMNYNFLMNNMGMNNFNQMNNNCNMGNMNPMTQNFMNFYQLYMNLQNQNFINMMNFVNNNNIINRKLPDKNNPTITDSLFPEMSGERANLVFQTPSGHKAIINAPKTIQIGLVFKKYINLVGLGPNVIGNGIYFLFNGKKITKNEENKTVYNLGMGNITNILVIDNRNLIGA